MINIIILFLCTTLKKKMFNFTQKLLVNFCFKWNAPIFFPHFWTDIHTYPFFSFIWFYFQDLKKIQYIKKKNFVQSLLKPNEHPYNSFFEIKIIQLRWFFIFYFLHQQSPKLFMGSLRIIVVLLLVLFFF